MILENLKLIKNNRLLLLSGIGILVALSTTAIGYYYIADNQDKKSETMVSEDLTPQSNSEMVRPISIQSFNNSLTDITLKLNSIEAELLKPAASLAPIQEQISALAQETEAFNIESKELLGKMFDFATKDLKDKLSNIENELAELKEKQKKAVFVKVENLPFNVLHIDNIQGNNITTIRYNNTIFPLTEGDYLAGWKLVRSGFNEQETEFINEKDEHVLVSLRISKTSSEVA